MKRIILCVSLAFLLMVTCFAPSSQKAYAASISENAVIILSGKVNEQNKIVIDATMKVNTGISGMTLELSYNRSVMVLSNVVLGSALSSLDPVTTNVDTEQGYGITPFKFNYLSNTRENDFSSGKLFTMTFDLFENIKDGNYKISLKYTRNKDVNYYEDGDVKTKNLFIDNAEIHIKNNSIEDITIVSDDGNQTNFLLIALCISIPIVATCGALVAIKLLNKKRNWKRI